MSTRLSGRELKWLGRGLIGFVAVALSLCVPVSLVTAGTLTFTTLPAGSLPDDIVPVPAGFGSLGGNYFVRKSSMANEQQLLAAATQHARAHLFLVEISSVEAAPGAALVGKECDSWRAWANMRVQLGRVDDREFVLSYSPRSRSLSVGGPLSELRSVFEVPGALRSRLVPTFDAAASKFFNRAMFLLPPPSWETHD